MIVYLASPNNQQQAEHVSGMPVLLSYACYGNWLNKGYQQSFARILVDSGAYSEFTSGKKIDLEKYKDWAAQWLPHADAVAGLDDIAGDWKKSLRNYEAFPDGFPTFHETDPPELLPDLIAMSRQRKQWLGLGLLPPPPGKRTVCARVARSNTGRHSRPRMGATRVHPCAAAGQRRFHQLVEGRHESAYATPVAALRRVPGNCGETLSTMAAYHQR